MARQAATFRRVQRPLTEGSIRPIFGSLGSFQNVPEVKTGDLGNGASATIQPPKGETWRIVYASLKWSAAGSGTIELAIYFLSASHATPFTAVIIERYTTDGTVGNGIEMPGTNPILLTNDNYLRFNVTASGGGQGSYVVAYEKV